MGEGESFVNGAEKPEPKKENSHTDHRDEFVASEGLTTAGASGLHPPQPYPRNPCLQRPVHGKGIVGLLSGLSSVSRSVDTPRWPGNSMLPSPRPAPQLLPFFNPPTSSHACRG